MSDSYLEESYNSDKWGGRIFVMKIVNLVDQSTRPFGLNEKKSSSDMYSFIESFKIWCFPDWEQITHRLNGANQHTCTHTSHNKNKNFSTYVVVSQLTYFTKIALALMEDNLFYLQNEQQLMIEKNCLICAKKRNKIVNDKETNCK